MVDNSDVFDTEWGSGAPNLLPEDLSPDEADSQSSENEAEDRKRVHVRSEVFHAMRAYESDIYLDSCAGKGPTATQGALTTA